MGIISRITTLIKAMVNQMLDRAEDPHLTLDESYRRQLDLLQKVKQGIVEVVTAKKRLELQAARLQENIATLDQQARRAVTAGREDLARVALERKQMIMAQFQGLDNQITELQKEQDKLTTTEQRLSVKIEAFRTRKEVIKAQYSAAEAQVRIGESLSGISEEMADVGLAVQRAEDKTERLRARTAAIDELIASGTLTDLTAGAGAAGSDSLSRELEKASISQGVEEELARLRQQVGVASKPTGGEATMGKGGAGS
ncbi:MAG: PspA/IM30 family protein [Chloroflexi bacterium]|nr:PspA/IM30 family protein [Chloroflexota bacterium]